MHSFFLAGYSLLSVGDSVQQTVPSLLIQYMQHALGKGARMLHPHWKVDEQEGELGVKVKLRRRLSLHTFETGAAAVASC